MQDDVVALCDHATKLDTLAGILASQPLEVFDECLLAVGHHRVVLSVNRACVTLQRLRWPARIEHQVVERDHSLLILLKTVIHSVRRKGPNYD